MEVYEQGSKEYERDVAHWQFALNASEKLACNRHVASMAYCERRIAESLRSSDWLTDSGSTLRTIEIDACKARLNTILNRAVSRSFNGVV